MPVTDPLGLIGDLARQAKAGRGAALLGLDFPIGLPLAFVRAAGLTAPGFLAALDELDNGAFLEPAATLDPTWTVSAGAILPSR